MGIEFRGKEYKRDVTLGKRTVKDGEAVAVWNRYGEHRQVIGPRLVRLFFSTIRFLDRKTAGPKEYLRVVLSNGTIEHMRGPVTMYENPVLHQSVDVLKAITLTTSSDCIVIHRQADTVFDSSEQRSGLSSESIQRVIVKGPTTYYPGPRETVVSCKGASSSARVNQDDFNSLILNTASRPWLVEAPFGSQQTRGTLQLAFRFLLQDVEAMLDNSSDPIGDLYEAVIADLSNISVSITDVKTLESINSFDLFPILLSRSAAIGVSMETVAFRGYEPSAENKRVEDAVKQMNEKISRDAFLAKQEEARIAADIAARQARLAMEHDLEEAVLAGKQARLAAEQTFNQKQQECDEELETRRVQNQLEYHRLVNDESLRVLHGLKEMGADITKLLCVGNGTRLKPTAGGASDTQTREGGRFVCRETLIATTPALIDWFSVPSGAEEKEEKAN